MVGLDDLSFLSSVLETNRLFNPPSHHAFCAANQALCTATGTTGGTSSSPQNFVSLLVCKFRFRKRFCRVDRCQQSPADILVSVKRRLFWLQAAMKIMRSWRIYCNLMDFWTKKDTHLANQIQLPIPATKRAFFPCGSGFFHIARVFFSETMAVFLAWTP